MSRWRLSLLQWMWSKLWRPTSVGACANRKWSRIMVGPVEMTLTMRHTGVPDGYSREELLEMLRTVRAHESLQGWRVPEPSLASGGSKEEET